MADTLHPAPHSARLRLLVLAAILTAAVAGAGILIRVTPWAGPALANRLRGILGDAVVTQLEELWAAVEDDWMRLTHRRAPARRGGGAAPALPPAAPPVTAPPGAPAALPESTGLGGAGARESAAVAPQPPRVVPPFAGVAAADDGIWHPVPDPERPEAAPLGYRTLIHPDPERSFAELFVVALPLAEIGLRLVAGTSEPESSNPEIGRLGARGLIAPADEPSLLAAFNGGFRTRHGQHGMIVQGVVVVPLRAGLCTVAGDAAGRLRIAAWLEQDEIVPERWYRQTPPCMLEEGGLHPGLANPESRKWGATLEGETVIRRSALALDRAGQFLYVGVSNFTTARALALGMQSVGGWTVAQLDVNWSYPKFLLFPRNAAGQRRAVSLFRGFLFDPNEMLRRPSPRDFFYVVRRPRPPS